MRSFLCLAALAVFASCTPAAELRSFEDASLRSVHFIEDSQGWAVGDEGAIWHTIDGGKHWERQPSGVRASLRSVQFLTPYIGWVAGREELPGGGAVGVVLYTRDGGLRWRRILVNSLPGLHLVRFVDSATGYLAGDGSDQFASGIFATTDAGRTWQPVPGPRSPSWRAGDFTAEGGALGGAWNRLATVRRGQVFAVDMDSLGGRSICGMQLRGDDGVAVGQGGLVLLARKSRGSTWDFAQLGLPREVQGAWDFHSVSGVGSHVWAVGRPGSAALHSSDMGKTWEVVRTGQSMPLHGVFFRDERKGWAVGELGTILATSDGGRSWQVQRRGGQRVAVLAIHARRRGTPVETVVRLGAEDGYLVAGICLSGPEPATAGLARVGEPCRYTEAIRQAGGACGEMLWQFPVSSHLARADRPQLLAAWDRIHGGNAAGQLLASMVLALRTYRPDVVLTDDPDSARSGHAADALVAEALKEAFRQAGDPQAFPAHLQGLHLEPHKARKLYGAWPTGADAQVRIDTTLLSPRLGSTVREFSAGPGGLLGLGHAPSERGYRLLADDLPGASGHRELMQGISLASGGVARREMEAVEEMSPEAIKAARERATLWAIAEAPPSALTSSERLLAQIGPALASMPPDAGARVAHGLGWQYARKGQWDLARETFLLMAERYPTNPQTIDAFRWLLQHQASSEARRRHELGQFLVVGQTYAGVPGERVKPVDLSVEKKKSGDKDSRKAPEVPSFQTETNGEVKYLATAEDMKRWYQGCLALDTKLSAFGPLHANDPAVQFAVQSARRQLGDIQSAQKWYREFAAGQPDGPWRSAALAELWLANRAGSPPRPVIAVRPCQARPYLDGKLDDVCWQESRPVKLQNAMGETASSHPSEARVSHDREFLYVAVRCGQPEGTVGELAKTRTRDADMRAKDRVSIMLDLDRDYGTSFHLQVDATGCVAEDCWGDRSWNPRWFVAVKHDTKGWTLEAAIPRTALTGDHITPGRSWAANVVRVLPGQGVQAFSTPAEAPEEAMRPEGMGLMVFTQETQQAAGKGGPATR